MGLAGELVIYLRVAIVLEEEPEHVAKADLAPAIEGEKQNNCDKALTVVQERRDVVGKHHQNAKHCRYHVFQQVDNQVREPVGRY